MLLATSRVCHGPCTASHCCSPPSPQLCQVPLSGLLTLLVCVPFFVIGCWQITGLP
ncbi:unnamed protein product [Staurois parvus]|uniref:Uncharacterized protein n=1 Tax=Staurois parvus TaxID=386267 RepID=A0ABN9B7P1_9NEOB|nr:unnamed protein product [Staurois parvus]